MDDHADHANYTFMPTDVMWRGLQYCGIGRGQQKAMQLDKKVLEFKAHYGSSPLVVANIWSDLCSTTIEGACLEEKEKLEKGFKKFMLGMFFLWTYPKNMQLTTIVVSESLINHQPRNFFDRMSRSGNILRCLQWIYGIAVPSTWSSRWIYFGIASTRKSAYKNTGTIWRTNARRKRKTHRLVTETTRLIKHFTSLELVSTVTNAITLVVWIAGNRGTLSFVLVVSLDIGENL
jgi:hypothetical protein